MNRKLVLMLTLTLLVGTLSVAFNVQRAKASGTIYIRADGSLDPSTAPIANAGNVAYTFFGDISDPIIVERDNIVIDGSGYTVQTAFYQIGINLSYRSNVTVKNTIVRNAADGIYLNHTTAATLIDNNLMNNGVGILLLNSSNCGISGDSVTSSQYDGIQLYYSSNNNSISGNNIAANKYNGITIFEYSNNNTIDGNTIRSSLTGINIGNYADSNIVSENIAADNGGTGINLESSSNTVSANSVTGNNGTGIFLLYSSNMVSGNTITGNNGDGVYLYGSFNTVSKNNISANKGSGMYVTESSNNTILGNSITANDNGIYLYGSYNNSIFHNNFEDNTHQIGGESYFINTWDDDFPSGGNYWSDYNGTDANHDGIGDTPYVIDAKNADNYPLMTPQIIPEFPIFFILPLFVMMTLLAVMVYRRKNKTSDVMQK